MSIETSNQLNHSHLAERFCQQPKHFAWFLGAGASRAAGLPSASDIVWDMKRRYYCREENQEISRQDIQNEAVRTKIQQFFDARGFPPLLASNEYSTYFEKIFGDDRERQRQYLKAILSEENATLSVGNRVIGALIVGGFCRVAFTTNFDSVVEKAIAEVGAQSISAYHIEGARSAFNALNNEEYPLYCKLHGDFRYDSLKNLSRDLEEQNEDLSNCFMSAAQRFGFVVAGYSGRDKSVMDLFQRVLETTNPFPHGLYWGHMKGSPLLPEVNALIDQARNAGVHARLVEIQTFDALMLHLWRNLEGKPPSLNSKVRKTQHTRPDIPLPKSGTDRPLLRMNALPLLSVPEHCLALTFHVNKSRADLQQAEISSKNQLVLAKPDGVWCWGSEAQARGTFGSDLASVNTRRLPSGADTEPLLPAKGFLGRGLALSLARGKPLVTRNRYDSAYLIADYYSKDLEILDPLSEVVGETVGVVPRLKTIPTPENPEPEKVRWSEAIRLSIEAKNGQVWLLIHPNIWIWPVRARKDAREFLDSRRRDRYNQKYNQILTAWLNILLGPHAQPSKVQVSPFLKGREAENPKFRIGTRTGFSRGLQP